MADYSDSKATIGDVYPVHATDASSPRLEPLINPDQLVLRFLWGIPLVSAIRDPSTNKLVKMTDNQIQDLIDSAVQDLELELRMDILPVQHKEKHAYDEAYYKAYGYLQLNHRPIASIEKVTITPANNEDLYEIPKEWIEVAFLPQGQLNVLPMQGTLVQSGLIPSNNSIMGGSLFFGVSNFRNWIPAYWQVLYTSGFPEGLVPRVINDLIGVQTAISILSMLAATYVRANAYSLAIDGLSQSVSTPGPQLFALRIQELKEKKEQIISKIKTMYGRKFSASVL